jgi:chromosome segregation ATPase
VKERLEKELQEVVQEFEKVSGQIGQLQQGLAQAQQRQFQLQGAHERLSKLISEVKSDATQDSSGSDRPVEAS